MEDGLTHNLPLLGNLPTSWEVVEFDTILDGGTRNGIYKPKKFHGRGVKIVNMGELFAHPRLKSVPMKRLELTDDELSRFELHKGDLIFARRSLVAEGAGKCSIVLEVAEPTTFESSIIRVRPNKDRANSLYLYYLFNSPFGLYLLGTIRRQVAVAGITGSDLSTLQIPLPPLPEQETIAHILGTLDDKIELNRCMNRTLETIAKSIFKSWFIDFDPVRAKAEGRQPEGMDAEVAALFPSEFEDSELGEIPRGWEVKPLDEVANFLNGLACQKYPPEGKKSLPVIKIREMRGGITKKTDRASIDFPEDYVIDDGDILFSWSGSLLVKPWCDGRGALNQHIFKVTSDEYPKWFYYYWVRKHLEDFQMIAKQECPLILEACPARVSQT